MGHERSTKEQLIEELEKTQRELRETKRALRRSEEKYLLTFANISDVIYTIGTDLRIASVSPSVERILGYRADELVGKHVGDIDILSSDSLEKAASEIVRVLSGERISTSIYEFKTKDGSLRVGEVSGAPIVYQEKVIGLISIARDITERRHVEEDLRESEQRYRHLVESAPAVMFGIDFRTGRLTGVNDVMCRFSGYTKEEFRDLNPLDILTEESRRTAVERLKTYFDEVQPAGTATYQIRTKDGREPWLALNARIVYEGDIPVSASIIAQDITELKKTEEALKESESKYRLVVENATDAIVITQERLIQYANRRCFELSGYSPEELLEKPFIDLVHPDDREIIKEVYDRRLRGEPVPPTRVLRVLARDGELLWVEGYTVFIPWGGRTAALTFLRNITEQKKLEAQLLQAQKMEAIGTLAGGVAHDFNNLLMGILGYTSMMLLETEQGDDRYDKLKAIEVFVQSGANLTKQLLGFARKGIYEIKAIDVNDLLDRTATMFGRTKKEITILKSLQDGLWTAEVDQTQIEQVFMNLFVNAWQAMPAGGSIHLKTANVTMGRKDPFHPDMAPGRYVKISVTDTGTGMDEKTMKRIFDPFFTTKEMGRGTGLGLAAVYGIITGHQGSIYVYSEKGHGTTFSIYLPASEKEARKDEKAVLGAIRGEGIVLLVDDEPSILGVTKEIIELLGYTVLDADSGVRAVDLYREHWRRIDLVILDMIMPGMGGGEVFDRLREINPEVKVILSSGYSLNDDASTIMARGCRGFLQKPANIEELSSLMHQVLSGT